MFQDRHQVVLRRLMVVGLQATLSSGRARHAAAGKSGLEHVA